MRSRAGAAYRLRHPWKSPAMVQLGLTSSQAMGTYVVAEEKESETVEIKILAVLYIYMVMLALYVLIKTLRLGPNLIIC